MPDFCYLLRFFLSVFCTCWWKYIKVSLNVFCICHMVYFEVSPQSISKLMFALSRLYTLRIPLNLVWIWCLLYIKVFPVYFIFAIYQSFPSACLFHMCFTLNFFLSVFHTGFTLTFLLCVLAFFAMYWHFSFAYFVLPVFAIYICIVDFLQRSLYFMYALHRGFPCLFCICFMSWGFSSTYSIFASHWGFRMAVSAM